MENEEEVSLPIAQLFTHGPAEVYEPVQTWEFYCDYDRGNLENPEENFKWRICSDETYPEFHEVDEIYINVPCATLVQKVGGKPVGFDRMVATGRLTISRGVAYIDL